MPGGPLSVFRNVLPLRTVDLETEEADALAVAQPERGREYTRLAQGSFRGALHERSDGSVGLLREFWSSRLRVRCARPMDYVAFSLVRAPKGARWCGIELGCLGGVQSEHDWEITTEGPFESLSFGVERAALEHAERLLGGGAAPAGSHVNRVLHVPDEARLAAALRLRAKGALTLGSDSLAPEARRALHAEFVHLAARLRRYGAPEHATVESFSRRRQAVRVAEAYLDAHEREILSLADLCAVTDTSERTLEYAFREQLGVTPGRYLRLRRLNGARRDLLAADRGLARVTDVAMRWGFWHLGRFAADYRQLFAERPFETLSRGSGASRPGRAEGSAGAAPPRVRVGVV
jgi:AraC family ethanolamine operon transcriptional activator